MEDLTELALASLDSSEDDAGNATENSPADDGENDTGQQSDDATSEKTVEGESSAGNEEEGKDDDNKSDSASDNSDDTSSNDAEKKPSEGEVKDEKESTDKKEPSEEDFERMAKARGYSKAPTEEEKRQKEQQQKQEDDEKSTIERLTKRPQEVPEDVWENTPNNNKMVYNSLPIITARGKNGTSVNVKLPTQLPDNFEFADEKARAEFQAAMAEQGRRSDEWLAALDNRDKQIEEAETRRAFARQTISEVEALQKTGDLPTPKAKPNTPEFKEDPAVKILDGVVGLRDQKMREGYRLSMADATVLFKSQHPELFQPKNPYNEKADAERDNVARKVATGKKTSGKGADNYNQTPIYRPGSNMSLMDVAEEAMRIEGIE